MKLSKEEQEIKRSIDRGDYQEVSSTEKLRLEGAFKAAAKKITRINIRLVDEDILKIKARKNLIPD